MAIAALHPRSIHRFGVGRSRPLQSCTLAPRRLAEVFALRGAGVQVFRGGARANLKVLFICMLAHLNILMR
jgi:hypothetical protein